MTRFILPFAFVTALVGCTPDDGDDNDRDTNENPASTGRIEGDAAGSGTVTVMLRDEATWADAETEAVHTDARGHFMVDVDYVADVTNYYVVQYDGDDGTSASALVYGTLTADSTLYAADLDDESTAEALVYVSLVERGLADGRDDALLTRLIVDADIAAMVSEESDDETIDDAADLVVAADAALDASLYAADSEWSSHYDEVLFVHDREECEDGSYDAAGSADVSLDALIAYVGESGEDRDALMVGLHAAAEAAEAVSSEDGSYSWAESTLVTMLSVERNRYSGEILADAMADLDIDTSASDSQHDQYMDDLGDFLDDLLDGELDGDVSLDALLGLGWNDYESAVLLDLSLGLQTDQQSDFADALETALDLRADLDAQIHASASEHDADDVGDDAYEEFDAFCSDVWITVRAQLMASGHFTEDEADALATVIVQLAASGSAS